MEMMQGFDTIIPTVCPTCHQPVMQQYYFCPNCGTNLRPAPLSTSIETQIWMYAYSIILPNILFITVTRWPGMKYYRSSDPKARMIGQVAWILIVLSTLASLWFAYIFTQQAIQSMNASINADLGSF